MLGVAFSSLLLITPVSLRAQTQDQDQQTVPGAVIAPQPAGDDEIDPAGEPQEDDEDSTAQQQAPAVLIEDIIPSEMISEDLAVDFPIDI